MNKQIYPLLAAQFLSAFADNALLFIVIAMILQSAQLATWYVSVLQGVFLLAFVILAPWAGSIADRYAKTRILISGNLIKAIGAGLLFFNVEPLLAYAIVGIGAAIYSPAKYGILPELVGHKFLVKANSAIEGATILAIVLGMVVGARVADYSITLALTGVVFIFIISIAITFMLNTYASNKIQPGSQVILFAQQIGQLFRATQPRFAILNASLFWATVATLRVTIIAWAPLVLIRQNSSEIAELTLFLAIGIIVGSALAPRLISLEALRLVVVPSCVMAIFIITLSCTNEIWATKIILSIIGVAGGVFIVPINATLQEFGQQSIGSGRAVAIQGFLQNASMLLAVGLYALSAALGVSPILAMASLGVLLLIMSLAVAKFA